jgi:pre-mRNA-splicing factor CWC26
VIGKSLATFQKSKNTWSTVGSTSLPLAAQPPSAGPSTHSNSGAGAGEEEEDIKPDIGSDNAADKEKKKAATIRKGGLRTAAQIREEAQAAAAEKAAALALAEEEARASGSGSGSGQVTAAQQSQGATVHRDSSGRIVDIEKLKKEAKDKEEEDRRKAKEREEWSKGMVQRDGQRERARQEAEMGRTDVARSVLLLGPFRALRDRNVS